MNLLNHTDVKISKEEIKESPTLTNYKDVTHRILKLQFPTMNDSMLNEAIDYSIQKRFKDHDANIYNNYTDHKTQSTILSIADYIQKREPILTAYGVLFRKHGTVPNPMYKVINDFLQNRYKHKDIMFTYEKGSEDYEHWDLVQSLDKIDANGIFGILTMNASLVYNIHVGASVLAQSRSQIASLSMLFEMFLANNVKFGGLNEVVIYIDNIVNEKKSRKLSDKIYLDDDVPLHQVFGHLMLQCGWFWLPTEKEQTYIFDILQNLSQEDLNRIYYKNNLYGFMENSIMKKSMEDVLINMEDPFLNPVEPDKSYKAGLDIMKDAIIEYVYYSYQIPDRIERNSNMVKSVIMISDTDSCIISLDAWYRYVLSIVGNRKLKIARKDKVECFRKVEFNEFGDPKDTSWHEPVKFAEKEYDYDFYNDDIIELEHKINPISYIPQDNVRYTIINVMCYFLDFIVNDYMEKFTMANNSWSPDRDCRIIAKNEFTMRCALLSDGKKNYASIQEVQEGNKVAESKRLDVKGLPSLTKSVTPEPTKKALKKILLEEILMADNISQLAVLKKLAILEKKIINSINSGAKDYYKPVNIKSLASYDDPMRIQGIKASVVWNSLTKGTDKDVIDLDSRNHVDIAKVVLDQRTVEKLRDWPDVYDRAVALLQSPDFAKTGQITAIAIPTTETVPDWVIRIVDCNTLCQNNISGFPLESIGIMRQDKQVNLSNILTL